MTADLYDAEGVVIRRSTGVDRLALLRLAALDEEPPLTGHVLLAEVGGVVRAARSLWDGRAVADPFWPAAPLLELLEVRHQHLRSVDAPSQRFPGRLRQAVRFRAAGGH